MIASTAYKRVQEIRGEADAKATEIYAEAYVQKPEAAEFYKFIKSMETYRKIVNGDAPWCFQPIVSCLHCLNKSNRKSIKSMNESDC
ncbi:hypothetical protein [Nitrosomonas communis]|uniref:hypothetical protein n=1 Tax=Nitrosomonas communis TaxID=44574 RepID=UPI00094577CE|nr:hypothetical protein [Nitrosomonas communis]